MLLSKRIPARLVPREDSARARLIPAGHSAKILDAVLMGFLVFRQPFGGIQVPTPQLAAMALLAVALFRRPKRALASGRWYPLLCLGLLVFACVETEANGISPDRRAANIAVLMCTAAFLATGRIDLGSAVKGLFAGLMLNAALFYLHLAPDDYQGRLTGFLQDKNASALYYAAGAVLASMAAHRRWARVAVLATGGLCVLLTDSRTTMAAYTAAMVWLLATARIGRAFQAILGGLLTAAFLWADSNIAEVGNYAAQRAGSDAFRARIDAASAAKTAAAPWFGLGLGQGTVDLEGTTWFFHNSYQDLLVEGGLVLFTGILLVIALAGFGLRARSAVIAPTSYDTRAVAAAALVILFCAARLGEVFLAPIGFVVIGAGLANLAVSSSTPHVQASTAGADDLAGADTSAPQPGLAVPG